MRRQPSRWRRSSAWHFISLSLIGGVIAGCEGEASVPKDGSPIVNTESDAYRKAREETEAKIKADAAAEAKARRKNMTVPE